MIEKSLTQLTIEEAQKLKAILSTEEKMKLNFDRLETDSFSDCVYGQITGDCFSARANFLISNCCDKLCYAYLAGEVERYPVLKSGKRDECDNYFWSPIEAFIDKPSNKKNGNNEKLIAFLKGESDELKFED